MAPSHRVNIGSPVVSGEFGKSIPSELVTDPHCLGLSCKVLRGFPFSTAMAAWRVSKVSRPKPTGASVGRRVTTGHPKLS